MKFQPKFHRWFQWIAIPFVSIYFHLIYRIHIEGRENIPDGGCVICPNHTALTDPPLTAIALSHRHNICIMAKRELFERSRFFARLITWLGAFPVSRDKADITAIKKSLQAVKDGRKMIIFPQGTRGAGENTAKEGAAMIALRTKAPVVPMYITEKKKRFHRLDIIIGKPFLPDSTSKDYAGVAEDIVHRIYALGAGHEA